MNDRDNLRNAAQPTRRAVCEAIGQILNSISADECTNYFANAGYGQT